MAQMQTITLKGPNESDPVIKLKVQDHDGNPATFSMQEEVNGLRKAAEKWVAAYEKQNPKKEIDLSQYTVDSYVDPKTNSEKKIGESYQDLINGKQVSGENPPNADDAPEAEGDATAAAGVDANAGASAETDVQLTATPPAVAQTPGQPGANLYVEVGGEINAGERSAAGIFGSVGAQIRGIDWALRVGPRIAGLWAFSPEESEPLSQEAVMDQYKDRPEVAATVTGVNNIAGATRTTTDPVSVYVDPLYLTVEGAVEDTGRLRVGGELGLGVAISPDVETRDDVSLRVPNPQGSDGCLPGQVGCTPGSNSSPTIASNFSHTEEDSKVGLHLMVGPTLAVRAAESESVGLDVKLGAGYVHNNGDNGFYGTLSGVVSFDVAGNGSVPIVTTTEADESGQPIDGGEKTVAPGATEPFAAPKGGWKPGSVVYVNGKKTDIKAEGNNPLVIPAELLSEDENVISVAKDDVVYWQGILRIDRSKTPTQTHGFEASDLIVKDKALKDARVGDSVGSIGRIVAKSKINKGSIITVWAGNVKIAERKLAKDYDVGAAIPVTLTKAEFELLQLNVGDAKKQVNVRIGSIPAGNSNVQLVPSEPPKPKVATLGGEVTSKHSYYKNDSIKLRIQSDIDTKVRIYVGAHNEDVDGLKAGSTDHTMTGRPGYWNTGGRPWAIETHDVIIQPLDEKGQPVGVKKTIGSVRIQTVRGGGYGGPARPRPTAPSGPPELE